MRISRLELAGSSTRPEYQLDRIGAGLNIVAGRRGAGKTVLADCIAQLLYGQRTASAEHPAGQVDIETRLGNFRLRRVPRPGESCRFTIASLGSELAAAETVSQVLRGSSPQFLSGLYHLDGAQPANIEWLLSESVAASVSRLLGQNDADQVDHHRQDEWLARRDELAEQVATLLAERRRTSDSIARNLQALACRRAEIIAALERSREELHAVDVELAAASTKLRYRELESLVDETARQPERTNDTLRLDDVDDQIAHWRNTLHELERREAQVRTELARQRPTETAAALPLADQRAALAVAERLVQDLRGEVARFARSITSSACVCRDAHPRLQPLVGLLEQQISRLVTLTDEHEWAMRSQELQTEAQHVARSQAELRDQLEHLQLQRESLSRRARPRRWRSVNEVERASFDSHLIGDTSELESRRHALAAQLEKLEQRLCELDREHQRAIAERTAVLSDRLLEQKQIELADVQHWRRSDDKELRALTLPARHEPLHHVRHGLRGSDYLAQLTDGRLIELKLTAGGRSAIVVDRHAQTYPVTSLATAEQHLVAMSLRLAIMAGLAEAGLRLPVILDEPFAALDDRQAAILAGVLRDFAGHQVFVFTNRGAALEQFRSWGVAIHDLHDLNRPIVEPPAAPRQHVASRPEDRRQQPAPKLRVERGRAAKSKRTKPRSDRPKSKRSRPMKPTPAKFFLELQSPIAAAPSITPVIAEGLKTAGVRQVRDLLAADASKLATRLAGSDIVAVEIVAWQHQARLCCRIPNLRPHEAAILVGAGFSTPEDVAAMKPAELLEFIESFAHTEEGRNLIGDGVPPDLAAVESWIRAARHSRVLGAA